MPRTVAVDFDNTIHPYSAGWTGPEPEDEDPFPGAEDFILGLVHDGYHVAIMSTRCKDLEGEQGITRWLHRKMPKVFYAMRDHGKVSLTCQKVPAVAYVDDRAVTFNGNYEEVRGQIDMLVQHGPYGGHR